MLNLNYFEKSLCIGFGFKPMQNMRVKTSITITAFIITIVILTLGYISFGIWPTVIFTSGF